MSKSKGNVIDPLVLSEKYGTDSLRFTLACLAVQGRDMKLAEKRVEGYRNFITKIWNTARFCVMNEAFFDKTFDPLSVNLPINQWVVYLIDQLSKKITQALDDFRFSDAALTLYQFFWHTLCDWYVEFAKIILMNEDGRKAQNKRETQQTLGWVFSMLLKLLHPFIPFVTEKLWQTGFWCSNDLNGNLNGDLKNVHKTLLENAPWPSVNKACNHQLEAYKSSVDSLNNVICLVMEIRSLRSHLKCPAGTLLRLFVYDNNQHVLAFFQDFQPFIQRFSKISDIVFDHPSNEERSNSNEESNEKKASNTEISDLRPHASNANDDAHGSFVCSFLFNKNRLGLEFHGMDANREKQRLQKEIESLNALIYKTQELLRNEAFLSKASDTIIETKKHLCKEKDQEMKRLQNILESIK